MVQRPFEFEQVLVLDLIVFFVPQIQQRPEILDDLVAFLDRLGGEQAEPGARTADAGRACGLRWQAWTKQLT